MSTAFYPTNMRSMPAGGYNHLSTYQNIPYIPWKGTGVFSTPTGVTSTNIRPLTNNDSGNVFQTGFGLPRPIKHYRKGIVIPTQLISNPQNELEISRINANLNRSVKSSMGASLGGGAGGRGLTTQMIDAPSSTTVKLNPTDEINQTTQMDKDCQTCNGIGFVVDYKPNLTNLTENPERNTTTAPLCCNQQRKAIRRTLPASTILKKNYYTTTTQYLQNRCQTYQQKIFNFKSAVDYDYYNATMENNPYITTDKIMAAKPGSPLATTNLYVANCQPNAELERASEESLIYAMAQILINAGYTDEQFLVQIKLQKINTLEKYLNYILNQPEPPRSQAIELYNAFLSNPYTGMPASGPSSPYGCKLVVYKPNNYQYATQGAVSSSTRILKLNVDTISTNAAGYKAAQKEGVGFNSTNPGSVPIAPFLYKFKAETCKPQNLIHFQNHKSCFSQSATGKASPTQPPFASNRNRLGSEIITNHR